MESESAGSTSQSFEGDNLIMAYQERLKPWAVINSLSSSQKIIISRHRSRVDAEEYLGLLRQQKPIGKHEIVFKPTDDRIQEEVGR
ncbi:hypothetical protein [Brasilonema sp. UFV-L1]|uniref:hypothetical protein n=1 Tax=Brasilonema sp. UFV-L1 TaxID=2234130 RepID=UPI00145FBA48|nr:hypothetical protein [Brasilonema sp. UFV-L1]NMG08581.1 hypothetical protein [Brasilonema sp. UFV-L1]